MIAMADDHAFAFHLEEFKALRQEIDNQSKSRDSITVYVTTANYIYASALLGYLLKADSPSYVLAALASAAPTSLSLLGRAIVSHRKREILLAAKYIESIEAKYANDGHGWESYIRRWRESDPKNQRSTLSPVLTAQIYLGLLLIIGVVLLGLVKSGELARWLPQAIQGRHLIF
jgi:hypothetical protein